MRLKKVRKNFHYLLLKIVFKGSDLVNWLLKRTNVNNRNEAVDVGQILIDRGIIMHINFQPNFLDKTLLYQLTRKVRVMVGNEMASGEDQIFYRTWEPEQVELLNGVIIFVHDLGDHTGNRLSELNYLSRGGYVIYAYDQRGHGQSPKLNKSSTYTNLIDDLSLFINLVASNHQDTPIFLYGHGMGSQLIFHNLKKILNL